MYHSRAESPSIPPPLLRAGMVGIVLCLCGCQSAVSRLEAVDAAVQRSVEVQGRKSGEDMQNPLYRNLTSTRRTLRERLLGDQGREAEARAEYFPVYSEADTGGLSALEGEDRAPVLSLVDALQVAAQYSREFQEQKERVFDAALGLDLEEERFRTTWDGLLSTMWSTDNRGSERRTGLTHAADGGLEQLFKNGISFTLAAGLDLVQLLSGERVVSRGIVADTSIQAQRDLRYAMWDFERYRRTFAVDIATEYMQVLESNNQVRTARDNYKRLIEARERATRMAQAGRLPGIQVDQALQDELRARRSWVRARQNSRQRLDRFRILLGLPPDAEVSLDDTELERLQNVISATPMGDDSTYSDQAPPRELLTTALGQRRDLKVSRDRLDDSERAIMVAADGLRAEATLLGRGSAGEGRTLSSATADDAELKPHRGNYSALLSLDLPFERRAETVALRRAILAREQQLRSLAGLEDEIKYQVRNAWGQMREALETIRIQEQAVKVAKRRVASTGLFLKAGRIQMRDLLEAQDALVAADNALVQAQVEYLIAALRLKRDAGELRLDYDGVLLVPYIQT
ncbi:MAG: TolC family protein [Geobacteraceae bacterium]|nr:TolC family protein [Geobacteraceae bacterium]